MTCVLTCMRGGRNRTKITVLVSHDCNLLKSMTVSSGTCTYKVVQRLQSLYPVTRLPSGLMVYTCFTSSLCVLHNYMYLCVSPWTLVV